MVRLETGLSDLRALLNESRAAVNEVVVIQYLSAEEISSGITERGFGDIQSILQEFGVRTYSTKELFTEAVAQGQEPFSDGIHPNELGQELLAECLLSAIHETLEHASQNDGEQSDEPKSR